MEKESIVLIGMAGVGKSTVGSALARSLGFSFTDLDAYIREKENLTVQHIIETRGEAAFLELEKQSMYEIDLKHRVVAPGGSMIYHFDLMEYLKRHSKIIYLNDSFENVESRLKNALTRGIVGLNRKSLREIYDERQPLYAKYADLTIDPEGKSPERMVVEILNQLSKGISNIKLEYGSPSKEFRNSKDCHEPECRR
jgi:shikimate kinase